MTLIYESIFVHRLDLNLFLILDWITIDIWIYLLLVFSSCRYFDYLISGWNRLSWKYIRFCFVVPKKRLIGILVGFITVSHFLKFLRLQNVKNHVKAEHFSCFHESFKLTHFPIVNAIKVHSNLIGWDIQRIVVFTSTAHQH